LFMPRRLVEAWLQHCSRVFEGDGVLAHWEFLFLVCNAKDRTEMIEKRLPHGKFRLDKDSYMQTYVFDAGLEHSRAPDTWLQELSNPGIDDQKIMFEFETNSGTPTKKRKPKHLLNMPAHHSPKVSIRRKMLRDPVLFKEIKGRVGETNFFLTKARQDKPGPTLKSKLVTPALAKLSISRERSRVEYRRLNSSMDCRSIANKDMGGRTNSVRASIQSMLWEADGKIRVNTAMTKGKGAKSTRLRSAAAMKTREGPEQAFRVLNLRELRSKVRGESQVLCKSLFE
jgi:hypothetical protein